jgi:hypothetical protein
MCNDSRKEDGNGVKVWPAKINDSHEQEYEISVVNRERRLPQNAPKRKLINKVIKILDSGNNKVVRALKSIVDALLPTIEPRKSEIKEGE